MISGVWSRVDDFHSQMYQDILTLSESVGVTESAPRRACRQQHQSNAPSDNVSDYYKQNLTIPVLDHLSSELDPCFDANCSQNLTEFMRLLPFEVVRTTSQLKSGSILQFYGGDLRSVRSFQAELDLWQNKWSGDPHLAQELNTPKKVLSHTDADYFSNIHTLIMILGTLPVTSCESERSISILLKRIKSALRSTMTEDRLNGLAMLQYHRDITVTADEVVEEFVQRQPRRLLMSNPLNE